MSLIIRNSCYCGIQVLNLIATSYSFSLNYCIIFKRVVLQRYYFKTASFEMFYVWLIYELSYILFTPEIQWDS